MHVHQPSIRYNHWEQKGVPLRLEVGPRDLESKQAVMARRDTGEKTEVPEAEITSTVLDLLEKVQVGAVVLLVWCVGACLGRGIINGKDLVLRIAQASFCLGCLASFRESNSRRGSCIFLRT